MSLAVDDFEAFHSAVHGGQPFEWQSRLLREVVANRAWPRVLDIPTGCGKTTCLDIALFALALDAAAGSDRWCPRRIAMVVDRRVVVDQAAERGRKLRDALVSEAAPSVVRRVASALGRLSSGGEPLGVFVLRGGIPRDDGWARTPVQPLILASTVDQLGSRLLIQGYGVSDSMRPVHAGLVGNDILLLLDEVHLSQPFAETLDQLARLRGRFAASGLRPRPLLHSFLSATPGQPADFSLTKDEKAGPLRARLEVPKPARLVPEVEGRKDIEKVCVEAALDLHARHAVVGVIVNRVASAVTIARQLQEHLGDGCDVVLVTGRMRPLDRDAIVARLLPRVRAGRARDGEARGLIVVGTQCLEAGADFDFDALVTEAASLDALRQRFGRLDRVGAYGKAEAAIAFDKGQKDDPVYGDALPATWKFLKGLPKKRKTLDFGVTAFPSPPPDELAPLLAPKEHAPTLLPAYLDLWMQTAPPPSAVPDVALWLHGPRAGPADVQVIWRADVTDEDLAQGPAEDLAVAVGVLRPSGLEAVSLPYVSAKAWLAGERSPTGISDAEAPAAEAAEDGAAVLRALRWKGAASEIITAETLRPGDTLVVPAARGGLRDGSFDPAAIEPVRDMAEQATLFARGIPALRLHPAVLEQNSLALDADEPEDARSRLARLAAEETVPWRAAWMAALARSRKVVAAGSAGRPWPMLQGKRFPVGEASRALLQADTIEDGIDLTTDSDDSCCAGVAVTLGDHSAHVELMARVFAQGAGLPAAFVEDLALAGWLHDVGKADPRFQLLLRGGDEVAYLKDERPWAKSGLSSDDAQALRLARERSGYPRGCRHEVQSLAMLEGARGELAGKAHDLDLVLHLVGSHHGHCRPFAPAVEDGRPVNVTLGSHLSERLGRLDLQSISSANGLHRLDSPLADRFWGLVAKYGWLDLCWVEAILRLADHRASEAEQDAGERA